MAARLARALEAEGLGPVETASPGRGPDRSLLDRIGRGQVGSLVLRVGEAGLADALHILEAAERGPGSLCVVALLENPEFAGPLLAAGATVVAADRDGDGEEESASAPALAREARARIERDARVLGQARQFRALAENLTETVVIVGPGGEIRYASPSFGEWVDVTPDQATGRSAFDFILAEDRAAAMDSLRMVADDTHPPGPIQFRVAAEGPPTGWERPRG
jgi:PAS domain-containing protein